MSERLPYEIFSRRAKVGIAALTLAASVMSSAVTAAIMKPDMLYAATGQQSDFEEKLGDALESSLGIEDVHVRCTDDLPEGVAGNVDRTSRGNYIRIRSGICETLEEVSIRDEYYPYGEEREAAAFGALTLAHEGQHVAQESSDEAEVQCYAVQTATTVAEYLGATGKVANQLGQQIAHKIDEWEPPTVNNEPNEYHVPDECRDGGRLDLLPDEPSGYFPRR